MLSATITYWMKEVESSNQEFLPKSEHSKACGFVRLRGPCGLALFFHNKFEVNALAILLGQLMQEWEKNDEGQD